jgi:hypothetical protein
MENLSEFYDAVVDLCDALWGEGQRLPAANLYLTLHSGSTSGEILPQVLQALRNLGADEQPTAEVWDRLGELVLYEERMVGEPVGVVTPRDWDKPSAR